MGKRLVIFEKDNRIVGCKNSIIFGDKEKHECSSCKDNKYPPRRKCFICELMPQDIQILRRSVTIVQPAE